MVSLLHPQRSRNVSSGSGFPFLSLSILIDLRVAFTHFAATVVKWFWELSPDFTQSFLLFPTLATNSTISPEQPSPYLSIWHLQIMSTIFWCHSVAAHWMGLIINMWFWDCCSVCCRLRPTNSSSFTSDSLKVTWDQQWNGVSKSFFCQCHNLLHGVARALRGDRGIKA